MALRFMDSWDHYAIGDITLKWTTLSTASGASIGANGRHGSNALRSASTNHTLVKTLDNQATWTIGVAFRCQVLPSADVVILGVQDSGSLQVNLRLNTTGTLSLRTGTTVLGTSAVVITAGVYAYLELGCTIHASAGTASVHVNGADVLTLTPVNTAATVNAFANQVMLGCSAAISHTFDFDDFYACDVAGSAPHNTFLGDCRVDSLVPNADGTAQQWTPSTPGTHYTLVDDAAPNTTDYVSSSTAGHRDTYGMQDLSAATGTIYGVQLSLAALKSDAGARSIKPLIVSGASEALGTASALATGQTYTAHVQTTDPATAAAWTEAAINSAQCGCEVA